MLKKAIFQISLLSGTIIGAGLFALPFVFKTAGLAAGFFYLATAAFAYVLIHLLYADLVIRTEGEHRFVGYAKIYLGRAAFLPAALMTIVQMLVVLAIYVILSKSFSGLIMASGGGLEKSLIFWFFGSLAIFGGLRRLAFLELLATGGIIAVIGLIFVWGFQSLGQLGKIDFWTTDVRNLLLPLAPILFALSGRVAIPSLVKYAPTRATIKSSVIIGTLIPAIVYVLFILSVLGLSGNVSEDAVSGLIGQVPVFILFLIGVLGLLSLWSSYITVGFDVYQSLIQDLKLTKGIGFLSVTAIPLLIYFLSSQSFIVLVSFIGGIFIALESIFIIIMWYKASRRSAVQSGLGLRISWLSIIFLLLLFSAALIYEIIKGIT